MQIKTTIKYHLIRNRMVTNKITSVGKDVEKLGPLLTVGRTVKWYSWYGKKYAGFFKTKK